MARPHGRARIDKSSPRALGVCDRCGFLYNHHSLRWQWDWRGPKVQNLRILVCQSCLDEMQQNGQRTFILPPDPIPIKNARPELYVPDDNPLSAVGASPNFFAPQYGSRIGNLTGGGGINSPFDGSLNKQAWQSACNVTISNSSYNNYVGINWQGNVSQLAMPSSLKPPVLQHSLVSFVLQAPSDRSFMSAATDYAVQYSPVDTSVWGAWTTIYSGATSGSAGENIQVTVTSTMNNSLSQFHRVAFLGDGADYVSVAQVQFNVAETSSYGGQS